MSASVNFGFLSVYDADLANLAALAERYFPDDPPTSLVKLRQFAELLAKLIAAHHGAYSGERENFEEIIHRLSYEHVLPQEVADLSPHPQVR
ncbi:hypothetical protein [Microvirga arabica]|uniref:hypothetical protein n=1 Tax=Microvirga arabica TaxID=1128671 RepID=UPI00193929B8|nr:hypothetical protein [Microvirga arabica]MBM1169621.1 hypothetical protein [Microvirga arabica]